DNPGAQATTLAQMAEALEQVGRGREMIPALKLAQQMQPRDDAEAMLNDAIGKYGFRVTETTVESDKARPRICAVFSEPLVQAGVDYAPFVQLPESGLSVEHSGQQLCVEGVSHGSRYALTLREGLPAASGEVLAKDVEVTQYVRDRSPAVRFPGRAYILPRAAASGIPVETVNLETLDLKLRRVSDRNLLRAIQNDYFARPLDYYQEDYFASEVAEEVWDGSAEVSMEVNRDVTTRLPVDDILKGLPAGIYALSASIPGVDPTQVPGATQWFVVSDLGLTTLSGTDGLHVIVRSLNSAEAKAGVTVTLLSRANSVLGTATTDAQGYAKFEPGLTRGTGGATAALVSVEEGDDMAFLSLTEPEFDLTDRGVAGREAAPPIDVFLTTDRGAYRAGETVHATALTRDAKVAAIEGLTLIARLMRPDGVEYARGLAEDVGAGGHVIDMPIGVSAPRGTWRLELLADADAPPLTSTTFLVEDFLPERIDFTLALPNPIRLGDAPELALDARYLFGAPAADLAVEGEVKLSAVEELEAFPGFRFGRHDMPFSPVYETLPGGLRTDADGKLAAQIALPGIEDPARPLQAEVIARVAEGSGRPVERRETVQLAPAGTLIGVKPMFEGDVAPEGGDARFQIVAVGADLKPAAAKVQWRINRIETNYQWYSLYGQWNWEETTTRSRVAEGDIDLTASGPVEISAPVDWGSYEIVVEGIEGTSAATSREFWSGWYVSANAESTPDTLELSLDKAAYKPGESATLRLVPREAGIALVSVMSNRLIAMQAVPVTAGENTVTLPVTDDWGAGAYVTASVIRPMDAAAGRNPSRALGLSYASVDPGVRKLTVAVEAAAESDPRGPLPVAVKVDGIAPGEKAFVTVAAVDTGILNLTGFETPDPEGHYFGQRRLGIGYRDIYGRLIDGLNGEMGKVRSGGDAAAQMRLQSPPPTEELVAYFSGPVEVGADGYARTSFDMPSFNGSVKLMAVAWSKTGVGKDDAEVLVRDPVVVTASLPRFLQPGDESRLLLEIVHASGPIGRMGLDVTAEGVTLADGAPSGFDLAEKGKFTISLPISAGDATGVATVRLALTTPDGKQLVKTLALPVQVNDPEIARSTQVTLAAGDSFTLDAAAFTGFRPGTGTATLAVGPLARFDTPGLLRALDAYPYGCTEQLTSRAMPLIYMGDVAAAMGLASADDISTRVDQAVKEVLDNQSANGAFGLWEPSSGDMWLDAYVTDFLSRARAKGHAVPDQAFRMALDNLRNQVNYAPDFDAGGGDLAYALMVLAREGAAAVGDLRYYADVKGDAFDTPLGAAQLGAALASYGDQKRADAMFTRAAKMLAQRLATPEAQVWRADYGTNLRDAAALVTLATEAGSSAVDVAALADGLATALKPGTQSTQESVWTLLATHALIDQPGANGFTVNGEPVSGPLVRVLEDDLIAGTPSVIANQSGEETLVTLTTFGIPAEPEPAGGNGYGITRSYYDFEGNAVDPANVKSGTRLVSVVEVDSFGGGEARLMIEDPLPAGFEIDNPNLMRAGDLAAFGWLDLNAEARMTEFRQDRFLAAVDWYGQGRFRLAYVVRAVSPGSYHHPAASVVDMYRPDYRGRSETGRVIVSAE
ncbi:MAG: alpha-2-macroglobulin family protein, partial [Paracoccaceae bacterium]